MQLFKFMKRDHLETTLSRGKFRVGTLHEYRDMDKFGPEIGDDGEGKAEVDLTAKEPFAVDILSDDPRAVHMRTVFKGWDEFPKGAKITIQMEVDSSVTRREEVFDHYMYCASMKCDFAQMRSFGYDACLRIDDIEGFFTEFSNCILNAQPVCGAPVEYRDRRIDYAETRVSPRPFLKPLAYAPQSEFRFLWEPVSHPITPFIITCPRALRYCEEVAVS